MEPAITTGTLELAVLRSGVIATLDGLASMASMASMIPFRPGVRELDRRTRSTHQPARLPHCYIVHIVPGPDTEVRGGARVGEFQGRDGRTNREMSVPKHPRKARLRRRHATIRNKVSQPDEQEHLDCGHDRVTTGLALPEKGPKSGSRRIRC